jgi:hypothetical protein
MCSTAVTISSAEVGTILILDALIRKLVGVDKKITPQ